ncbi:MAG TPA: DUF3857 and transglutaminase domain-containing protein [Thermoanaerobaculia bacterium]|nr:DUF3857 and transglutaminase domain-containing protein [Thermoanaerobaculia bacterium]
MKHLFALLLLSLPLFAADAFHPATPEELAMKDVPWAPGAPAVLLEWSVRHDDEESHATEYRRIKVLKEEGKKYGDVELISIPRIQNVREIRARTISPSGAITDFNGKVYEKVLLRRGGRRLMQKSFTLPDVQPGSILEYRYTVDWPSSQLKTNRWMLQREIPIAKARFWIRPYRKGISSICLTKGLPPDQSPKNLKDRYEFEIENVPPFEEEPMSPPELELKPRLEFFYTSGSASDYWMMFGINYGKLVEEFIGNRAGIRKAAAELTAGAESPREKLQRLYTRVQQLRNLTYENNKTAQEEKKEKLRDADDIEDVLRSGYGDRIDLNRLFAGLARAAGFEADMMLVSSRDESFLSRALPDADQLTSEIVIVKLDGAERFLDPGTPQNRLGLLPWENTNVPGLRIKLKGSGTWLMTPDQPFGNAVTSRSAELQLVDGVLKGSVTISWRGQEALQRRLESRNEDEAANRKRIEDEVKELLPSGSIVKLQTLSFLDATEEPLVATFAVELPNTGSTTGSRTLLPLSIFALAERNPFSAEKRKYAVYYDFQHQVQDAVTLKLPAGFAIESLPKPVTVDSGASYYVAGWTQKDASVKFERTMTVKTIAVAPQDYPILRKFYGDVAAADQTVVVLKSSGS